MFEREMDPSGVTCADIVVIIPSYQEADNISVVTRVVAEGLSRSLGARASVIINADNASPDGTGEVFLSTPTQVPKIHITTPAHIRGKGWNIANALRKGCALGARAFACVDADLRSITPDWIEHLVEPVLDAGIDYVTPIYARHRHDGTITNTICYPLVYGLLGRDIRQPIGGEFALSARFARHVLTAPWQRTTHEYGIDIFMTLHALLHDFQVAQVRLGAKVHKPSAGKLGPMFTQVVHAALGTIVGGIDAWKAVRAVRSTPVYGPDRIEPVPALAVDRDAIRKSAVSEFRAARDTLRRHFETGLVDRLQRGFAERRGPRIDDALWVDILIATIAAFHRADDRARLIESVRGLYWGRVFTFMNDTWEMSNEACEAIIRRQGERLFERRDEVLERLCA